MHTEGCCDLVTLDCQYPGVTAYNSARDMDVPLRASSAVLSSSDSTSAALAKSPLIQGRPSADWADLTQMGPELMKYLRISNF